MANKTTFSVNFKDDFFTPPKIPSLVKLWILRILMRLGAKNKLIKEESFDDDGLARSIGLHQWLFPSTKEYNRQEIITYLYKLYVDIENRKISAKPPLRVRRNINKLAKQLGLTKVEVNILTFAVLLKTNKVLEDVIDLLGNVNIPNFYNGFSVILGIRVSSIKKALEKKGTLIKSGLLSITNDRNDFFDSRIDLISLNFASYVANNDYDLIMLLSEVIEPTKDTQLKLSDYEHLKQKLDLLLPYLKNSFLSKRNGVNFLFYGPPGTGKTQLAKVLAEHISVELYNVSSENCEGEPIDGEKRLRACCSGQYLLSSSSSSLLLFDEIEDVFSDGEVLSGKSTAQKKKAWINKLLENNMVPTIWISNDISEMDPAFIRRFDFVVEVPIPSQLVRQKIYSKINSTLLSNKIISKISKCNDLSPAVFTSALSIIKIVKKQIASNDLDRTTLNLLNDTLKAQGHKVIRVKNPHDLPENYNPSFNNANYDLLNLKEGLVRTKSGRICLYGPPGTGKTALARWLAQETDKNLIVKKASDLISAYVGHTEQNIAEAFNQAEQDDAMLLIDEIDSFLQERSNAQNSWEISAVNEILTQMESFSGIFIASTNLMDRLDKASLRRFDLKIKLDFLSPENAVLMLKNQCFSMGFKAPSVDDEVRIKSLNALTPGDFAAIVRRNRFMPITTPSAFVDALVEECELKGISPMKIGFG